MSDNAAGSITASATADESGLVDVSRLTFEELSSAISGTDLGRALDYIMSAGQNGSEYYGFNSSI